MTDHLPECPVPGMEAAHGPLHPEDAEANCICTELRACEERVREEWYGAQSEAWGQGFLYALAEARKAVAGGLQIEWFGSPVFINWQRQIIAAALAAIDALRTGQEAEDLPGNEQPVTGLADHPSGDGSARTA